MALVDRPNPKLKPAIVPSSGEPFGTVDADRFAEAGKDEDRQRVMLAADRYHAASKQRDAAS